MPTQSMKIINAIKIVSNEKRDIKIVLDQADPALVDTYGYNHLSSTLKLPAKTIRRLRVLHNIGAETSDKMFLEKILRVRHPLDELMLLIRLHKLEYKISAHTHCHSD